MSILDSCTTGVRHRRSAAKAARQHGAGRGKRVRRVGDIRSLVANAPNAPHKHIEPTPGWAVVALVLALNEAEPLQRHAMMSHASRQQPLLS